MISRRELQKFLDITRQTGTYVGQYVDIDSIEATNWMEALKALRALNREHLFAKDRGLPTRSINNKADLLIERALTHISDLHILDQFYRWSMGKAKQRIHRRMIEVIADINGSNIPKWFELMARGEVFVPYAVEKMFEQKVKELLYRTLPLTEPDPLLVYALRLENNLSEQVTEALELLREYYNLTFPEKTEGAEEKLVELNEALAKLTLYQLTTCYHVLCGEPTNRHPLDPHFCAALSRDIAARVLPLPVLTFIANKDWYPAEGRAMAMDYLQQSIGNLDFPVSTDLHWALFAVSLIGEGRNSLDRWQLMGPWRERLKSLLAFEQSFTPSVP